MPPKKGNQSLLKVKYELALLNIDSLHEISQGEITTERQRADFKIRYTDLESNYQEFLNHHCSMQSEINTDEEVGMQMIQELLEKYKIYNKRYYDIKNKYMELFSEDSYKSCNSTNCTASPEERKHKRVVLPRIQLPTFSGKIEEYSSFINLFETLIGSDSTISDNEKLYYLISTLSGEPKTLIQHLNIIGDNYSIALELLDKRYNNKRLLADRLLGNILNMGHVSKHLNSLRSFLNNLIENSKALEKMGFPVEHWSYLLFYINFQKLDLSLRKQFESKLDNKELPTFCALIEFLENEVRILESSGDVKYLTPHTSRAHLSATQNTLVCKLCQKGKHHLSKCDKFIEMKIRDRKQYVKENKLCFKCLNEHNIVDCKFNWSCYKCNSNRHHYLIHFDLPFSAATSKSNAVRVDSPIMNTAGAGESVVDRVRMDTQKVSSNELNGLLPELDRENSHCESNGESASALTSNAETNIINNHRQTVLLSTAIVCIMDRYGHYKEVRALLDGGSQSTFITNDCVKQFGLRRFKSNITSVMGLGGVTVDGNSAAVNLTISPRHSNHPVLATTANVIHKITGNLPNCNLPENLKLLFNNFQLADEYFYKSRPIDILIGADILGDIIISGNIKVADNLPVVINTIFGHVLMGPISYVNSSNLMDKVCTFSARTDEILENFFELENIPLPKISNPSDIVCDNHFKNTHQRNNEGRYIVRLPFLENPELGDSIEIAKRRFFLLEKRLSQNEPLRKKYIEFMQMYKDLGHMSAIDGTPEDYSNGKAYIIPHHGIFKAESEKIRVVFDASCVTNNGKSLNDVLHAGPKLQLDVMEIICRFRLFKYVFTTDIKMMFRQIVVHPDDRRFQVIFWRNSPEDPLLLYELNTVTYGMKSSPFLAIRTLRQLAEDNRVLYPEASKLLESSVFMDDILGGADTALKAKQLKNDLTHLLRSAGFELSKWVSNNTELLEDIPTEDLEKPRTFDKSNGVEYFKILGLEWNPNTDYFSYRFKLKDGSICTKRNILSAIARMFDPLGWISPVILQGKVLIQRLWRLNLPWDQTPPADVVSEWNIILRDLPKIEELQIKRCVLDDIKICTLHGFSDASETGYSAAVYLRTVTATGVQVFLYMAKSRVAPSKMKLTIPKLELLGATLLTRLIKYVVMSIQDIVNITDIFCWSDSTIVLTWLRIEPHNLQTFEGNRVSQINNCGLRVTWRHLPSEMNPADVGSRGCRASELLDHKLWWGPQWLLNESNMWPPNILENSNASLPGIRKAGLGISLCTGNTESDLFYRYSSLIKLQSVVAYCLRFIHNAKNPKNKITGILTVLERRTALYKMIKMVQSQEFVSDIKHLVSKKILSTRLRRLLPFIDDVGLMRVGGRLEHSSMKFQSKHPVILPKNHPLTHLIIDNAHKIYCHVGATTLQTIIQKEFWILSARQAIRNRIFKCIFCFRTRAKPTEPLMSALPKDRVTANNAFHTTQTDFAGPFYIRASRLRKATITKAYLCVFICSATKGVHLEVVSDLSTEAFLAALSRFVSRRGLPHIIRSDCGTNYIGTSKHLNDVQRYLKNTNVQWELGEKAAKNSVTWLFNPPAAPHFGGLFEAAVKSAKGLLKRVIGEQVLTFEELTTVFAKIEAVLNSRPLCPLSSDPQELDILTPAHLMIGKSLLPVPEYNLEDVPISRLSRFKLVQALLQRFWRKWSDQYLHTLQNRNKWTSQTNPPKIGELVLIKEDNVSPMKWRLGRIVALLPGSDGIIRVVSLKTSSGTLTRPVVKICRLPID